MPNRFSFLKNLKNEAGATILYAVDAAVGSSAAFFVRTQARFKNLLKTGAKETAEVADSGNIATLKEKMVKDFDNVLDAPKSGRKWTDIADKAKDIGRDR